MEDQLPGRASGLDLLGDTLEADALFLQSSGDVYKVR